jgi:hypothetical protein
MESSQLPTSIKCEYVKLQAKLRDGRELKWSLFVPNREVDTLLGTASAGADPYMSSEEFGDVQVKGYLKGGVRAVWDAGKTEEIISPGEIDKMTFSVEETHHPLSRILRVEAQLANDRAPLTVRPARRRPSTQDALGAMSRFMNGETSLNEFFAATGQPERPEALASILVRATARGYETASGGTLVDLSQLFSDPLLFAVFEIRRAQMSQGIVTDGDL